jgi:hypothetical protein
MSKPPHIHNRETPDGDNTQFAAKFGERNVSLSMPKKWLIGVASALYVLITSGGTIANLVKPAPIDAKTSSFHASTIQKLDDLEKRMGQLESAQGRLESGQALLGERIDRLADRWHGSLTTNNVQNLPYVYGAPGL